MEKYLKIISAMQILWWVFLGLEIASVFIKGGGWLIFTFMLLAIGTVPVEVIYKRKIKKMNDQHFGELIRTSHSSKL